MKLRASVAVVIAMAGVLWGCQSPSDVDAARRTTYEVQPRYGGELLFSPSPVNLGCAFPGQTIRRTITLFNLDPVLPARLNGLGLRGAPSGTRVVVPSLPHVLAPRGKPGDSLVLLVEFRADKPGSYADTLIATAISDDTVRSERIAIAAIFADVKTVDAYIKADTVSYGLIDTVLINIRGGFLRSSYCQTIDVLSYQIVGPDSLDFTVLASQLPYALQPGESMSFTVQFRNTGRSGTHIARVVFQLGTQTGAYTVSVPVYAIVRRSHRRPSSVR